MVTAHIRLLHYVDSVATGTMGLLMLHERPSIVEDFLAVAALHGNLDMMKACSIWPDYLLIRMLLPQVNIEI